LLTLRTAFLTLTDSTGFHHSCGWPVLEFVEAMKHLLLSCTNSFTATNQLSHLLLTFTSRPALNASSYSATSRPSGQTEDSEPTDLSIKHCTNVTAKNFYNCEIPNPKKLKLFVNLCVFTFPLRTLRQNSVQCAGQTEVLTGIASVSH
jgi:hypothetical protein